MNKAKLLITGSSGFLGQNLISQYQFENVLCPSSKELDLLDSQSVNSYFTTHKINKILHCASNCGGINKNKKYPFDLTHDNLKMTINLFEMIKKHQIEYFYSLGTVCSYASNCPVPFREDDMWNGKSHWSNRGYSESKRMLITEFQSYKTQYGLKGVILVPTNMYGCFDHFNDLENSHIIPALIDKVYYAKKNHNKYIELWGSGEATRDLIFAGDVCSAINIAISQEIDNYEPINLGTGSDISIKNLAYMIKDLMDYRGEIVFLNNDMDGQAKRLLDCSRAKQLLNWQAETTLEEGLKKTICWYRENCQ